MYANTFSPLNFVISTFSFSIAILLINNTREQEARKNG
jgi:hypothetical protein